MAQYRVCIVASFYSNNDPIVYDYDTFLAASDFVASVLHGDYYPLHTVAAVQINEGSECVYSYVLPDDPREVDAEACGIDMWVEAEVAERAMPSWYDQRVLETALAQLMA